MDSDEVVSTALVGTISEWLADQALSDSEPATLYAELCQRLCGVGIPIVRGQAGFAILHPLYDASTITWTSDKGAVVTLFRPEEASLEPFVRSPLGHALAHRLPVLRRRLTGEAAIFDFPVLEEFRSLGGTDYVLFLVGFDGSGRRGVIASWLADRAGGFTDSEVVQLQRITRELGISMKSRIERIVARNVAQAYLGRRAGEAVLNGLIRRGDGEKIEAALWYSDLRQSTALADRLSAEDFLELLGRYFEMTAAAVLANGGEVVSLIGDAVLGLFRVEGSPQDACRCALTAAREARRRLAAAEPMNGPSLDFGIALHLGQVIHGNVGVPERLQFTIVGSAVNEVVRVQDLTKQLGCPLLVTAPFAAAVAGPWRSVGDYLLRGLGTPMPIFAVAEQ